LPLLQVGKFADTPYRMAFSVGGFRSFSDGLANGRPFAKKALEPDLKARLIPRAPVVGRPDLLPARLPGLPRVSAALPGIATVTRAALPASGLAIERPTSPM